MAVPVLWAREGGIWVWPLNDPFRLVSWAWLCPGEGTLGEELLTDPACVLGRRHGVAHGPRVSEDLMVIPPL